MESLAIGESRALWETPLISFGSEDMTGVVYSHSDALVIRAIIANYDVARILVDYGSSVNVLFHEALNRMQLKEVQVEVVVTALFGFASHAIHPVRQITLPLTLGNESSHRIGMTMFLVVDVPSAYNIFLSRPFLSAFMVMASPYYQKLKFPIGRMVGEVQGDQKAARGCYVEMVKEDQKKVYTKGIEVDVSTVCEVQVLDDVTPKRTAIEEGELINISKRR